MTVGGGEAADQMVRMMLSGGEVAVRLGGSALKNLLALTMALAKNNQTISGKVSMTRMGIRDKHLIWNIKRILKAPIKLPDGTIQWPDRGTPQGGIISPLLANIVLNELDHWIESQWQRNPIRRCSTSCATGLCRTAAL